jgi:outer membrane protein assembly factor BamB
VSALVLLFALAQEKQDWPTYHGGYALDGVSAAELPDAPAQLWRWKAPRRVESTPVSAGGRIFVACDKGMLFALDLQGKELWKAAIEKDFFASPPFASDGLVVIGTSGGSLLAFDAASGKEKWVYKLEGTVQGSPNRVALPDGKKGIIAVSQADGTIHAVELETGKPAWKTEPVERCDGSPGIGDGRIVMGSCASALHVYSIEKKAKEQDIGLGGENQVAGGVAFSGKTAFAGTRSGAVVAVDVAGGKVLWTNSDGKREAFTTPAVGDALVVYGSDDGKVCALKRDTGAREWVFDAEGKPSSAVIAAKRVVLSAQGQLFLLDLATGKKVWSAEVSDELTSPAIIGGMIVVGADDGTVTAYGRK